MAVLTYKCPNCSGPLKYDPEQKNFTCEYCGSSFTEEEIALASEQFDESAGAAEETQEEPIEGGMADDLNAAMLYSCPSCGAEIVTDSTTAATYCFFCHNPVVLSGRLSGEFRPDKVIPFEYNREKAIEIFEGWIETKKYVPDNFFSKEQIEKLTGVYFPYWVVDCQVESSLSAKGSNTNIWRVGDIQHTEVSHYSIERGGHMSFNDIMKLSLKKADRKLVEGIQPFDMDSAKDFNMSYLSGFQAEKRDMEQGFFMAEINSDVNEYASTILQDTISGYGSVTDVENRSDLTSAGFSYALVPVWVMTYKNGEEMYYYSMNGQNAKIFGKLPVDKNKLMGTFLKISGVLLSIGLLAGYFI